MSEPVVLRSEAIASIINKINGVEDGANGQSNEELQTLSSNVSSNQTSLSVMRNDIVQLKESVALLKNQIVEIVNQVNVAVSSIEGDHQVDISDVGVERPDDPTEDDVITEQNPNPITYRVDSGALNIACFQSDSTSICKHYTYDNLHVVMVNTSYVGGTAQDTEFELATFPTLSTYSGNSFLPAYKSDQGPGIAVAVNNNSLMLKISKSTPYTSAFCYTTFWFDRSQSSRLFDMQDGQLISSVCATANPSYATHACVGNLHFLTISTQLVSKISGNLDVSICQFPSNLSITTGAYMGTGWGYSADGKDMYPFAVTAPNNNTIAIRLFKGAFGTYLSIPANTFITINLMWIDSKATGNNCSIALGTVPACDSADRFAKHFNYKHLNVIQMYGNHSSVYASKIIGRFDNEITLPAYDSEFNSYRPYHYVVKSNNAAIDGYVFGNVKQSSQTEFSDNLITQTKTSSGDDYLTEANGYINAQILWMA